MNTNPEDDQLKKDFVDSIICEELDADSIPAELMAEFDNSAKARLESEPANMLDIDFDIWSSDPDAQKRR